MKKHKTATELWLESVRKQREIAAAQGRFFDGTERDNIISFARYQAECYEDTMPSECNPD